MLSPACEHMWCGALGLVARIMESIRIDVDMKLHSPAFFHLLALNIVARSAQCHVYALQVVFISFPIQTQRKGQPFVEILDHSTGSALIIWTRFHLPSLSITSPTLCFFPSVVWLLLTNIIPILWLNPFWSLGFLSVFTPRRSVWFIL